MALDGRLAVWVATHRWAPLDGLFVWLGNVDRLGAVWVALTLGICLLARRPLRSTAGLTLLVGLTTFAADAASFGVKDLTHRTRPFVAHPRIDPLYVVHSSSFPAGHAATAFAGATLLWYVARRGWPLYLLLALAVAYSRVYVGVHYPGDVLGGALIGLAVGGAVAFALATLSGRLREDEVDRGQLLVAEGEVVERGDVRLELLDAARTDER